MTSNIWDIASVFGITPEILKAVAAAEADPTTENVQAVFAAYAANGQTPPAKLATYLLKKNQEKYPSESVAVSALPYLLIGGILLFTLIRR